MRALALGFGALFLAGLGSASLHEQGSRLNSISLSQLRAASLLDTGGSDWLKPDPSQSSVIYNNHNEATQERPFRAPNARGSSKGFEDSALATGAQGESAPDVASETPTNKPSTEAVEKVILNEAGASELRRLPGVGVRRAEQILALRAQVGHFRKLSDLLRVKGIGPKLFRRMLPMLLLDRPVSPAPKPSVPAGT
jgi:competence ComEA-like helix-hairpin-helix protein